MLPLPSSSSLSNLHLLPSLSLPFLPPLRELFTHPANLKTRSAEVDDRPIDGRGRDAVADCADVTGETFSPKSLTFDVLVFFHRVTFIPLPSLSLCHRDDSPKSFPQKPRRSFLVTLSLSLNVSPNVPHLPLQRRSRPRKEGSKRQYSGSGPNLDRPGLSRNETRKPRRDTGEGGRGKGGLALHPPTAFLRTCPELRKNNDRPRALSSAFGRLDSATDEIGPRICAKAAAEG